MAAKLTTAEQVWRVDLAWHSSSSPGQLIVASAADECMAASRDWLASREWQMSAQ